MLVTISMPFVHFLGGCVLDYLILDFSGIETSKN